MSSVLFGGIENLKGIGSAKAEKYQKLGITSVYELICHFPKNYLDFHCCVPVRNAVVNEHNCIKLKIKSKSKPQAVRNNLVVCKAVATDGTDDITIVMYNNVASFNYLKTGYEYYMYGKVTENLFGRDISSPVYIHASEKNFIQPMYRLTQGLTVNVVRADVKKALSVMRCEPFETLSGEIQKKYNLRPLMWSLENVHFPDSRVSEEQARRRLAFDELLRLQLGMSLMRNRTKSHTAFKMDRSVDIDGFISSLPFELTDDQKKASFEIIDDLCSDTPMNRLLQGDVGSGKTAVASIACCFSAKNGIQSALMAPTEILASQHYKTLCGFLEPFGIRVCLLTGSLTPKKKSELRKEIADGGYDVIVGTHAIIQKDVEYKSLGLVITDEQHRFGVAQRSALAEKGGTPHKLVMSATPIPRTLALMIYGDLDISVIAQLPKGRKPVTTYAVTGKMRKRAFNFVRDRLREGRQAYVVCPMIEDSESELFAVKSYADNAVKSDLIGYSVELLHGKMSAQEKENVMQRFRDGQTDVLICTTVVEVGVDVPNAVVMVIENAERFGLSQIHQLRGRVGRGQYESFCILITDNTSDECIRRMKIMSSTTNGFEISEEDLKMRGPGDFFGNAQHGLPTLKVADISCDMALMNSAKQCASEILAGDPELSEPYNSALKMEVIRLFDKDIIS
ncbi:MAG: ATP-dependent DNA helicase RecG [Ruminococcus flavefaciens]|nr:ATP-dependent DNA helicase RecG [Ruminococcus flavefaciens]